MTDDQLITVQNVVNVIAEHMNKLDELWPDSEQFGPRKVHIVELIDAIKLRLIQQAEKNANRYESAFERAAKKITGTTRDLSKTKPQLKPPEPAKPAEKTAMQLAHEAAQSRMRDR